MTFVVENPQCGNLPPLQSKVTKEELSKETKYPEQLQAEVQGKALAMCTGKRTVGRVAGANKQQTDPWATETLLHSMNNL